MAQTKKEKERKAKEAAKKKAEAQRQRKIKSLLKSYVDVVNKIRKFPTRADLAEKGITRDTIRHYFVNLEKMRDMAKTVYPEAFEGVISVDDYTNENVTEELSNSKVLFLTTAVNGQFAHQKFMDSIATFCKKNKAKLALLPSHDPAHNLDNEIEWHFDSRIVEEMHPIIFEDYNLNSNLHISGVRINAKQINPTTGLSRISQGHGSFIFASPKQSLEFIPNSNVKMPHAMMSTGSCTLPNYKTTKGNSLRTAFLAHYDHVIGGIIVEIKDDKIYHFRQVQADKNGKFIDLGIEYSGKGTRKVAGDLIMGDYHAGEHDEVAVKGNEDLAKRVKSKRVFLHDMFNGNSISHHEQHNIVVRAQRAKQDEVSLEKELQVTSEQIDRVGSWPSVKEIVMVKSNHDEFLIRWLQDARFNKDPLNFQMGCKLADLAVDDVDPLQAGIETVRPLKHSKKVTWLQRDEDYKIAGIECGAHGDKGPNGSRGTKKNLEKAYGQAIIGHSHTPGILRGIFQVGTTSKLHLGYNVGPSSWVHCSCVIYPNGQRQLINFINGEYTTLK